MSRKGRNRGFPAWYKGRLRYCEISGFWYGEREGKLSTRRGILVDKKNLDSITDKEREKMIKARTNRTRRGILE